MDAKEAWVEQCLLVIRGEIEELHYPEAVEKVMTGKFPDSFEGELAGRTMREILEQNGEEGFDRIMDLLRDFRRIRGK